MTEATHADQMRSLNSRIDDLSESNTKLTATLREARELFERQQVSVLGFDVVFAEADESSGLSTLRELAQGPLRNQTGFQDQLERLAPSLNYDALFAQSLQGRPVVLGYYLSGDDRDGIAKGALPPPALPLDRLRGLPLIATSWKGYSSNIESLAAAAPTAGFFNSITDEDGVVRSLPLLAEYQGQYYESLALGMFRSMMGMPGVEPGFPATPSLGTHETLESVVLVEGTRRMPLPVDDRLSMLIPFRGPGGPDGGSYQYIAASDVIEGRLDIKLHHPVVSPAAFACDRYGLFG